jgi:dethiobiotin synthetase
MMKYFVTAIGTDSGKTMVSAILCKALQADYWKPVQAGYPTDSETVKSLVSETDSIVHTETYVFKTPASPHAAAALENVKISLNDFVIPNHTRDLIIEGAGGCLVPLNDRDFVIDLANKFSAEIILVSNLYLGSINHTLLSWEAIKQRRLPVKGIVFNGNHNAASERIILHHTGLRCLLHVEQEAFFDATTIEKYSKKLKANWNG